MSVSRQLALCARRCLLYLYSRSKPGICRSPGTLELSLQLAELLLSPPLPSPCHISVPLSASFPCFWICLIGIITIDFFFGQRNFTPILSLVHCVLELGNGRNKRALDNWVLIIKRNTDPRLTKLCLPPGNHVFLSTFCSVTWPRWQTHKCLWESGSWGVWVEYEETICL